SRGGAGAGRAFQTYVGLQGLNGSRHSDNLAAGVGLRFGSEVNAVLILRIGIVRVGANGLLELFTGRVVLAAVDEQRAHVVEVLAGSGRIQLSGLIQIGPRVVDLLVLGERDRIVVVI